jgi:hypothetical protein
VQYGRPFGGLLAGHGSRHGIDDDFHALVEADGMADDSAWGAVENGSLVPFTFSLGALVMSVIQSRSGQTHRRPVEQVLLGGCGDGILLARTPINALDPGLARLSRSTRLRFTRSPRASGSSAWIRGYL